MSCPSCVFVFSVVPDRTIESLYEELAREGIIVRCPKIRLSEFVGDYRWVLTVNGERLEFVLWVEICCLNSTHMQTHTHTHTHQLPGYHTAPVGCGAHALSLRCEEGDNRALHSAPW